MELQTALFLQQHKADFSAMSELLGQAVGHQGEHALLQDAPPPQQPVLTASKILAAQTSLTPDNAQHHYYFLSSYRLRDLDPHAVHKLPNGSRIKSVGDIVTLLDKDEPHIMTNFQRNDNAAGHEMLRMIQNLVNACENSPVRMEISTVVQVLVRVLTQDPDSSWTAKIDLLLSNIYSLQTRSGLKQLISTIHETGMCTRGPCTEASGSLWHAALTNAADTTQVQEDYGLILQALSAILTANAAHEQQYAAAVKAYDYLDQTVVDDALAYLIEESKLLADMQATSGRVDCSPLSDEMRIKKLIHGSLSHVRDAIDAERDQGKLKLFGMSLQDFTPHFIRINNYATDAQIRRSDSSYDYDSGITAKACAVASVAKDPNLPRDPPPWRSQTREEALAHRHTHTADAFERMQRSAKPLGLSFCEFHGWDSHDTAGCPDPIEKQPCLNWTRKGNCARGRKCKYMHDSLPPVPGPSQIQANAKASVAAATQCTSTLKSRADQIKQISQNRIATKAKMIDTIDGADYESEDSDSSH